jgi:hypothetical protein
MAKKRKSTKKRKNSRKRSTRRRGMGSVITVQRAGMGAFGRGAVGAAMPSVLGGGTTAVASLLIRYFVKPGESKLQAELAKRSWLYSWLAGLAVSMTPFLMKGSKAAKTNAAVQMAASATVVGLFELGASWVAEQRMAEVAAAAGATDGTGAGVDGLGAIVFNRMNGMGAIVPEYSGRQLSGGLGSRGETVSLQGLNTSVFGTPGFSA